MPEPLGGPDCIEWVGNFSTKTGYGRFSWMYKDYNAHRVSYQVHRGDIPDGLMVLHDPVSCNNRRCVNPDHLRVGTPRDNQHDRRASGTDTRGEQVFGSKLTESDVIAIRRLRAAGVPENELAEQFGVHRTNVNYIVNRKTWTHLP